MMDKDKIARRKRVIKLLKLYSNTPILYFHKVTKSISISFEELVDYLRI